MKKSSAQELVDKIITQAQKKGITVPQLAKGSGFDKETIRRWRVGINDPSYSNLEEFKRSAKLFIKSKKKK